MLAMCLAARPVALCVESLNKRKAVLQLARPSATSPAEYSQNISQQTAKRRNDAYHWHR